MEKLLIFLQVGHQLWNIVYCPTVEGADSCVVSLSRGCDGEGPISRDKAARVIFSTGGNKFQFESGWEKVYAQLQQWKQNFNPMIKSNSHM